MCRYDATRNVNTATAATGPALRYAITITTSTFASTMTIYMSGPDPTCACDRLAEIPQDSFRQTRTCVSVNV